MSQYTEYRERGFIANADLSLKQNYIVALDTANQNKIVLANAQTLPITGVLKNAPKSGDSANVVVGLEGTYKVICGGTVSIGSYLTSDASGKAIATTTAADMVIGMALEAGVSGQVIEYQLMAFRYR